MSDANVTLMMVGDIILDEPDADSFFDPSRAVLAKGDVVIGHVEVPHTSRGIEQSTDVPAPPADPKNLDALRNAGFNVATLAGNHIFDSGTLGIEDTVSALRGLGIATTGAAGNLTAAKAPGVIEKKGVRVGVLSYNCVGPRESWATSKKAGCAYVKILTHYELDYATPGGPPTIYTFAAPESLDAMADDIRNLRSRCEVVVVALHKGVGHLPAEIAMYEGPVAKAAIDAGADVVIGHHAHIMRGIEIYRGKPIFHGLGNYVCVTRALTPVGNDSPERQAWARRREKLFGFAPDPTMPTYPFHPESRNTVIARCTVGKTGLLESGFIPCYIDQHARPQPLSASNGGQAVVDYVAKISAAAGLSVRFEWVDDWVAVREA
ncbi:MAG: CapA family protein [Rhodocyclaceae bacterium]|nr:MAG: CapA family protein [Rhodocyclaceae bacterium]